MRVEATPAAAVSVPAAHSFGTMCGFGAASVCRASGVRTHANWFVVTMSGSGGNAAATRQRGDGEGEGTNHPQPLPRFDMASLHGRSLL